MVYVDTAQNPFKHMAMSHMIADTLDELHQMADAIGLKREWFQAESFPHYDVSKSKRRAAIELGALEIGLREEAEIIKRLRKGETK